MSTPSTLAAVESVLDEGRLSALVGRTVRAARLRVKPDVSLTVGLEHPGTSRPVGWARLLWPVSRVKADNAARRARRHGRRTESSLAGCSVRARSRTPGPSTRRSAPSKPCSSVRWRSGEAARTPKRRLAAARCRPTCARIRRPRSPLRDGIGTRPSSSSQPCGSTRPHASGLKRRPSCSCTTSSSPSAVTASAARTARTTAASRSVASPAPTGRADTTTAWLTARRENPRDTRQPGTSSRTTETSRSPALEPTAQTA